MGFRNFTTTFTTYLSKNSDVQSDNFTNSDFLYWFSGFTDGEGNFLVTIDRKYVKLRFKINLHIFFSSIRIWFIKLLSCLLMYRTLVKTEGLNTKLGASIRSMRHPTFKVKYLPNISNERYYSSKIKDINDEEIEDIVDSSSSIKLNPQWISGFTDAEGCFMVRVFKQAGKTGWGVSPSFVIHLHAKDKDILYALQNYFGVGVVYENKNGKSASYTVKKLKDIVNIIIPHFKSYSLYSEKCIDFKLWSMCIDLIVKKVHLTTEGLNKIVGIKCALNKGISESLKTSFDIKPLNRPEYVPNSINLDPNWVSGFSEGDSSFFVTISGKTNQVRVTYSLGLNKREFPLISKLQDFFGGIGKISSYDNVVQYRVFNLDDIRRILIPHFDTYNLKGNKLYNYLIWKEIINLLQNKSHLTREGLDKINNLRCKLNIW